MKKNDLELLGSTLNCGSTTDISHGPDINDYPAITTFVTSDICHANVADIQFGRVCH